MREVVMQTAEKDSTIEDTEIFVKIIDSNYANYDLDKFSVEAVQLDNQQQFFLLSLLK